MLNIVLINVPIILMNKINNSIVLIVNIVKNVIVMNMYIMLQQYLLINVLHHVYSLKRIIRKYVQQNVKMINHINK